MSLLTHLLAGLFGLGSWVSINGLWVELPLIVPHLPEGWHLPSYLSVLIQMANVGPLFVTLMYRFRPGVLNESSVIYAIVGVATLASFLLAFFWNWTCVVGGADRSVALFVLTFFLSAVDCTSSVAFLPFMARFPPRYLTSYFVGEGVSGLLPALVALAQGVGAVRCLNATDASNATSLAEYQPANFSVEVFFFFLSAMMLVCLLAFAMLRRRASVTRGHDPNAEPGRTRAEQRPMMTEPKAEDPKRKSGFGSGSYSPLQVFYIFVVLGWVNALTNTALPSVQSYSCLPYGNRAYHLSAALAAVANPLACFVAMFVQIRSLVLMGVLTLLGSAVGAHILAMAALSPCPPLVGLPSGPPLIVLSWVLFVLSLSYVKVMLGLILRDEGALLWCGAVVQLGSLLGAVTMFPLVSVYQLFSSGDPCSSSCAS